jgi:hypothetical protein
MIDTHKLTIIPIDGSVVSDYFNLTNLDLSTCNVPNNVHALQWNNPIWPDAMNSHLIGLEYGQGQGWIELRSTEPNIDITQLPEWALNCFEVAKQRYNGEN